MVLADVPPGERGTRRETWLSAKRQELGVQVYIQTEVPVGLRMGDRAPDFTVLSPDGAPLQLSDFLGQVVIVNFWATWCEPCRQEMPLLQRTYDAHDQEGLAVLGVSVGDSSNAVQAYVQALGVSFPIGLDSDRQVSRRYRVFGLPTSVFIDREGLIQAIVPGPVEPKGLERDLADLLAASPGS